MIKFQNVSKKFGLGTHALDDINFSVDKNEFVFLVGPTGSGKTTIFRLITREYLPTQGSVLVGEWDISRLPKEKVPTLRKRIGVVFQDLKILQDKTVLENVLLPLEIDRKDLIAAKKRAEEVLGEVGLSEHTNKFPTQLSGGELQRVAIARALVLSPEIILADEPTGNLDPATSWEIVKKLIEINEKGTTIIMATHNFDIVKNVDKRVIALDKGKLVRDERKKDKEAKKQS
ncbi:MAG TPA: ATP-binding cassette domain-containing protein [Patescibacteria group bacterium]|nr:ATP-binding cassette domain-containing protein [Patescibacteria group bacterium]